MENKVKSGEMEKSLEYFQRCNKCLFSKASDTLGDFIRPSREFDRQRFSPPIDADILGDFFPPIAVMWHLLRLCRSHTLSCLRSSRGFFCLRAVPTSTNTTLFTSIARVSLLT